MRRVGDDPSLVLEVYSDSAYKTDLQDDFGGVSATFNAVDLFPYHDDENLWESIFKKGQTMQI